MLKKKQVLSESCFKKRIDLLQWISPSKCKQRTRRATPKRQTWNSHSPEPRGSQKHIDHGQQGYWASDSHDSCWTDPKGEDGASLWTSCLGVKLVWNRTLGPTGSTLLQPKNTRVRRDIARDYPVTPMGHSSLKENKWAGPRDSKWASHPGRQVPFQAEPASMARVTSVPGCPLH